MGTFFNGGSRKKPRYERLPLDTFYPSESTITRSYHDKDLDENNLFFDVENSGSQNGRLLSAKNEYDSEEEIEFYKDNRRSRNRGTSRPPSRSRCSCLVCLLIVLVIAVLLFCALYLIEPSAKNTAGWTSSTYEYATETAIRLYDINQDGVKDVIVGGGVTFESEDIKDEVEFCKKQNMTYPCAGLIMALDGRNGTRLWTIQTKVEVFAIQCGKLDINGDGHMDCVAAGRMATLHGIDPIKGVILWSADPDVTNPHFNFYQGQVVPDLDQDGVQDFVVTHGGDTRFSEKELDRPAGRLLLLSGKTGRSLGRYLSLPDGHETYSAITLYPRHGGAVYLLFGSGGETIAGSLWTISLRDLYCHVMSIPICSADNIPLVTHLQNKVYDESWGTPVQVLPSGAKEIIRSGSSKGVTVPTELVDMNNDDIDDLVVFMYNGTIAVLDGVNLEVIWSTGNKFAQFETYSNPAPGYFNDDDTVDLMVRLSEGNWPRFKSSYVYILDGRNGDILWYLKTPSIYPIMSSPLTLQSYGQKDAFIFWAQGLSNETMREWLESPGHTGDPDGSVDSSVPPGRPRRHGDKTGPDQLCRLSMDVFRADLLLVDRDLALKPLRLASIEASKYNYSLTKEDRLLKEKLQHDHKPVAIEMAPPDTYVTPSSKSDPLDLPTKAIATEEDLARHNLHRPMTTSAVTTTESLLPVGLDESTTSALTTPEGSRAVMSTSGIIEETRQENSTAQITIGGSVFDSSGRSTSQPIGTPNSIANSVLPTEKETNTSQPASTTLASTTPASTTPAFTTSASTTPASTTPASTTPAFTTSAFTTSASATPASTIPASTTPAFTTSAFTTSAFTTPAFTTPASTTPASTTPASTTPASTTPASTTPAFTTPAFTTSAFTTSAFTTPASTTPASTTSASTDGIEASSLKTTATQQLPTTDLKYVQQQNISESKTETQSLNDNTSQMLVTISPQAVNLTNISSSNNKSGADTNEPTVFAVTQGTNLSSEELHTVTTDLKEEITNNTQSITNNDQKTKSLVGDQESSTQQKTEIPPKPALQKKADMSTVSGSEGEKSQRRRREIPGSDYCSVYQPSLFGTGIIGDLDNDGNLDYIYADTQTASVTSEDSNYLTTKLRLRVQRLVLKNAIKRQDWVRLEDGQVMLSKGVGMDQVNVEKLEEHFQFLPADKQSWTSYMGENGDGNFRKNTR